MNPVEQLLQHDENKENAVHALGRALGSLEDTVATYRRAWRESTRAGWARTDLIKAGFPDPNKLPKTPKKNQDM